MMYLHLKGSMYVKSTPTCRALGQQTFEYTSASDTASHTGVAVILTRIHQFRPVVVFQTNYSATKNGSPSKLPLLHRIKCRLKLESLSEHSVKVPRI